MNQKTSKQYLLIGERAVKSGPKTEQHENYLDNLTNAIFLGGVILIFSCTKVILNVAVRHYIRSRWYAEDDPVLQNGASSIVEIASVTQSFIAETVQS